MPCTTKTLRRLERRFSTAGQVPTVPTVADHCTTGWLSTDIYLGEWVNQITDDKIFTRTTGGIRELPWLADTSGNLQNSLDLSLGANTYKLDRGNYEMLNTNALSFAGETLTFVGESLNDGTAHLISGLSTDSFGDSTVLSKAYISASEQELGLEVTNTPSCSILYDDQSLGDVRTEATVGAGSALLQYDDASGAFVNIEANGTAALMSYADANSNRIQVDDSGFGAVFNTVTVFSIQTAGDIRTNQAAVSVAVRAKTHEIPIYDSTTGLIIGYIDVKN